MGIKASSIKASSVVMGDYQGPVDPYYGDVALLLHMNGAVNSHLLVDNSQYATNKSIIESDGNPFGGYISTGQSKFYGTSLRIALNQWEVESDWTGPQFSRVPGEPYTIETFFYFTSTSSPSTQSPSLFWLINGTDESRIVSVDKFSGGSDISFRIGTADSEQYPIPTQEWVHLAVTMTSDDDVKLWVNGVETASVNSPALSTSANGGIRLGANYSTAAGCEAYLAEFRVTKGIARYTTTFTPPTTPFPNE